MLGQPSLFTLTAIEDSTVLEYEFAAFRSLVTEFPDIVVSYAFGLLRLHRETLGHAVHRIFASAMTGRAGLIEHSADALLHATRCLWFAKGWERRGQSDL